MKQSISESSTILSISSFGMLMGLIHVLTGADHLSALSVLSSEKNIYSAFFLGIRWGVGHSFGLMVVASVFFAISQSLDLDLEGDIADKIVGFFMFFLGLFGWMNAYYLIISDSKLQSVNTANVPIDSSHPQIPGLIEQGTINVNNIDNAPTIDNISSQSVEMTPNEFTNSTSIIYGQTVQHNHDHFTLNFHHHIITGVHPTDSQINSKSSETKYEWYNLKNTRTAQFLAVLMGLVHGISGPGGVLGVLPAVALHNPEKSSAYLGCFFITSIITMGIFSASFGKLTSIISSRSTKVRISVYICVFTSTISIVVGVVWLVLSFTVGLDEYGL
eukprot:gene5628-11356_t